MQSKAIKGDKENLKWKQLFTKLLVKLMYSLKHLRLLGIAPLQLCADQADLAILHIQATLPY